MLLIRFRLKWNEKLNRILQRDLDKEILIGELNKIKNAILEIEREVAKKSKPARTRC